MNELPNAELHTTKVYSDSKHSSYQFRNEIHIPQHNICIYYSPFSIGVPGKLQIENIEETLNTETIEMIPITVPKQLIEDCINHINLKTNLKPTIDQIIFKQPLKSLEEKYEHILPSNLPYIVRVDGHNFSQFTKPFTKPCDERIITSMISAASDVLTKFNALSAYVASDEASFVFYDNTNQFNLRTQKLSSLIASYMSIRFNFHLNLHNNSAFFDARVFSCPDKETTLNAILYRTEDTYRNGINSIAHHHLHINEYYKSSIEETIRTLERKGINLDSYPKHLLYGTFIKKEQFEKDGYNPITKQHTKVLRKKPTHTHGEFFKHLTPQQQLEYIFKPFI